MDKERQLARHHGGKGFTERAVVLEDADHGFVRATRELGVDQRMSVAPVAAINFQGGNRRTTCTQSTPWVDQPRQSHVARCEPSGTQRG